MNTQEQRKRLIERTGLSNTEAEELFEHKPGHVVKIAHPKIVRTCKPELVHGEVLPVWCSKGPKEAS